ncbi:hypothetical protein BJ878DRAFT_423646 [Calycina marina]|uniref:Mitochondrial adapter protein MCP1 transmembrane domain-containing protein n=1 Tax=Calycina marina TaxID=1763456 RepID=A0A9P8CFK0_9HELO|nr:hypothetical protein BJ878DRAFT_423646 [Calycina marina]
MEGADPYSIETQAELLGLRNIDPIPLPDSRPASTSVPANDRHAPRPALPSSSSFLGLRGTGRSSVWYLTQLQRYSSYAFSGFAALHITNTSIIPLVTRSVADSESYLLLTRPYYQSMLLEPVLITLPITTHVLAGLALRIHRRNQNLRRYGAGELTSSKRFEDKVKVWPAVSWSSLNGYILTPMVLGHALVNRTLPWVYEGGSSGVGLGYVSHGFAKHPFIAWTGYAALIGVGVAHFIWGVARWQKWTPVGVDRKARRRRWTINGITALVSAIWMAGGLGVVGRGGKSDGWVGKGHDNLYSKIPLLKL